MDIISYSTNAEINKQTYALYCFSLITQIPTLSHKYQHRFILLGIL